MIAAEKRAGLSFTTCDVKLYESEYLVGFEIFADCVIRRRDQIVRVGKSWVGLKALNLGCEIVVEGIVPEPTKSGGGSLYLYTLRSALEPMALVDGAQSQGRATKSDGAGCDECIRTLSMTK